MMPRIDVDNMNKWGWLKGAKMEVVHCVWDVADTATIIMSFGKLGAAPCNPKVYMRPGPALVPKPAARAGGPIAISLSLSSIPCLNCSRLGSGTIGPQCVVYLSLS
jgi:hypothetical protein